MKPYSYPFLFYCHAEIKCDGIRHIYKRKKDEL